MGEMSRVVLIHWNAAEAAQRLEALRAAGMDARLFAPKSSVALKDLESDPPDVILINLARLPSQGGAVAIALRQRKSTRAVPIVFLEGDPEKTEKVRALLPDAAYTTWPRVKAAVKKALASKVVAPVVPETMAGYSGTPLAKKLGIKPGIRVLLLDAPDAFEEQLAPVPDGVDFTRAARGIVNLVLLFAESRHDLVRHFEKANAVAGPKGHIWVIWPKKASGISTDLTERFVRAYGLERQWVDFKICAVDAKWSGLCFARR